MDFTVLMSVYDNEIPEFFQSSLDSILCQVMMPQQVVVVKDGVINGRLNDVLHKFSLNYSGMLTVVELEKNVGLGLALNEGLKECKYEIVARMDTDDISHASRFERQLSFLNNNPEYDVIGSNIYEFINDKNNLTGMKRVPESHEQIFKYAHYRNPMNHSTVIFKKSAVMSVGGYVDCKYFEDYYLWIRMLNKGYRFYNLQEPLLYFRVSNATYQRRGGTGYISMEIDFLNKAHAIGFITELQLLFDVFVRAIFRIVPNSFRKLLYIKLLRGKILLGMDKKDVQDKCCNTGL